jgi:hypothetical protein
MDTEAATIRDKERFKMLEQKIQDMLLSNIDYRQIVRELDYSCKYSTQTTTEVVRILHKIRKTGLFIGDNDKKKKLQKVMNHYAIERNDTVVLKP